MGSTPKDDSAERARQAEEARKAQVAQGMENINAAFAPFDDAYYDSSAQYYTDFYQPELQEQYNDAYSQMIANLYRTGNISSSAGAETLGKFQERLAQETSQISGRAADYAAQRRNEVESARSNLVSQLNATADPAATNAAALAQASNLNRQQTLSPLGAVFADLLNTGAQGVLAERQGYRGFNSGLFDRNRDSNRVVT